MELPGAIWREDQLLQILQQLPLRWIPGYSDPGIPEPARILLYQTKDGQTQVEWLTKQLLQNLQQFK
jgi:hypothetical protein